MPFEDQTKPCKVLFVCWRQSVSGVRRQLSLNDEEGLTNGQRSGVVF